MDKIIITPGEPKGPSKKNKKMKILKTPSEVRQGLNNKDLTQINGRIPVIVTIPISKRKADLGVQFWTEEQIKKATSTNTDGTFSKFIELY